MRSPTFLSGRPGRTASAARRFRGLSAYGSLGLLGWLVGAQACGGSEFCAENSYECGSPTGGKAGGAGAAGSAGKATGGSGGTAGKGGAGGSGGVSGSGGGDAGAAGADGGTSGTAGGGGEGGTTEPPPPTCDPDAPVMGCIPDADNGIFVSPDGNDENDGTPGSPLATIGEALVRAGQNLAPIFICSGTFDEKVTVTDDGVSLHGGFACPTGSAPWVYDVSERPLISPVDPGYALEVTNVTGLTVADVEVRSANAAALGESSIAVFVSGSEDVAFSRVRITAGDGANGANADEPASNWTAESLAGADAMLLEGGAATPCECGDGSVSVGASGGDGGATPGAGSTGTPSDLGGGQGSTFEQCRDFNTNGANGGNAPNRPDALAIDSLGALSGAGWVPAAGESGTNGTPGQGGGGGGGLVGGGGGGGGCGGCGGSGGGGGKGGGASIGVIAVTSQVTFVASLITTGDAGAGGGGVVAEPGQGGGARGNAGVACLGGNGGKGGDGGAGGGGAGGLSVGVLHTADSNIDSAGAMISVGMAGARGLGAGADNDGVPGVAEDVWPAE